MVAATYGFVAAFGQNIALIPTLTTAMRWFPNRRGTVMGIVVGGFGGGALVFNQIQTAIVNPDNISVKQNIDNKTEVTHVVRLIGIFFSCFRLETVSPMNVISQTAIFWVVFRVCCSLWQQFTS